MTSAKIFLSNKDLMKHLKDCGSIKSDFVLDIMCSVDRKHFVDNTIASYTDRPQHVAFEKTISAPHMHANVLEYLSEKLRNGGRVLDIGSGSGYLTTCMAMALGKPGIVIGIDCLRGFYNMANKIIKKHYPELFTKDRIKFIVGDGRQGYRTSSPFNVIYVGLAATDVPQTLLDQLAPGGCLIMPIGDRDHQVLCSFNKSLEGVIEKKLLIPVRYGYFEDVKVTIPRNTVENTAISTSDEIAKSNRQTLDRQPSTPNYAENFEKIVHNYIERVENRINTLYADVKGQFDSVASKLDEKYEKTSGQLLQKIGDIEKNFRKVDSDFNDFKNEMLPKFKEYSDRMNGTFEGIEQKINKLLDEFQQSKDTNEQNEKQMYFDRLREIEKIYIECSGLFEVQKTEIEKANVKFDKINQQLQNMLSKWETLYVKSMNRNSSVNDAYDKSNFQIVDQQTYKILEKKLSLLNEQLVKQNERIDVHERILDIQIAILKKEEASRKAEKQKTRQEQKEEYSQTFNRLNKEIEVIESELENQIRGFRLETAKNVPTDASST